MIKQSLLGSRCDLASAFALIYPGNRRVCNKMVESASVFWRGHLMLMQQVLVTGASLVLLLTTLPAASALDANHKDVKAGAKPASIKVTHAKKSGQKKKRAHHYGAYFVPPPPAYMPSILPELQGSYRRTDVLAEKPENPYGRYIYSRDGSEVPSPVQARNGVTTWAQPNSRLGFVSY